MLRITKLKGRGKFYLGWDEKPSEPLTLDFNPIIFTFNLKGKYLLIHWQARPKGLRKWGFYDSISDNYYSPEFRHNIQLPASVPQFLQLTENDYKTVPTAVVYIPDASIKDVNL
jgi:hypothetical protein